MILFREVGKNNTSDIHAAIRGRGRSPESSPDHYLCAGVVQVYARVCVSVL